MSLATWKKEFYPVSAELMGKRVGRSKATDVDLVEHSIQKWRGLLPESLAKHNVAVMGQTVCALKPNGRPHTSYTNKFEIDVHSCALCEVHNFENCPECPLAQVRANKQMTHIRCDVARADEDSSPFAAFAYKYPGSPKPMLEWLEKALEHVKGKKKS